MILMVEFKLRFLYFYLELPFGGFPKNPKHVASNKPDKINL